MYSRSSHPSGTDGRSPQCPWPMGQLVPIPWLRPRCVVAHQCARRDKRRDRSCRERCSFSRIPASLCPLSLRSRLRIQLRIDLLARVHTGSTDLPLWALRRDPGVRGMAVTARAHNNVSRETCTLWRPGMLVAESAELTGVSRETPRGICKCGGARFT
jgi:hypothetical protein